MLIQIMLHTSISGSVTQSYESVDMQKRFAITSELHTFYPQEQKGPIFWEGTSQLVTRSSRHTVKWRDELTVVSGGVVTSWPYFLT